MKTMSRTRHHVAGVRNPIITNEQAKDALRRRAEGILEDSRYYTTNMSALNRRVSSGKVDSTLARRIRPSIVAQAFRNAHIPLDESRRLTVSLRGVIPGV